MDILQSETTKVIRSLVTKRLLQAFPRGPLLELERCSNSAHVAMEMLHYPP